MAAIKKREFDAKETTAISIANSAAIAAAMVAIENDRIMAIASAVMADTRTKCIHGLLVLIAHILKQKVPQTDVPKPLVGTPSNILPEAKPPAQVDPVKYKQAVDDFKDTIATNYPKVDRESISVSPVAIEKDATNNDKYILFASFDVDCRNITEYTQMIV